MPLGATWFQGDETLLRQNLQVLRHLGGTDQTEGMGDHRVRAAHVWLQLAQVVENGLPVSRMETGNWIKSLAGNTQDL